MTLIWKEKPDSRKWSVGETRECTYLFWMAGTNSDTLVRAMVLASTALLIVDPLTGGNLWRGTIQIERDAWQKWDITVPYSTSAVKEVGDPPKVSFELTMQTTKVTHSLSWVDSNPVPGTRHYATTGYAPNPDGLTPAPEAPDFKGTIGVNKDGKVEGCEILVPEFSWSETWRMDRANVESLAYRNILYAIGQAPVNDAPFRDFAAGEVLFDGASDSAVDEYQSDVTFKFKASPNLVDLIIGDITVASKPGWAYLDIHFAEELSVGTPQVLVAVPKYAYVHTVHYASDFSLLRIGT